MVVRESFGFIRSDRFRHFTAELAASVGSEYENLQFGSKINRYGAPIGSGYGAGRVACLITNLVLEVATQHSWTVGFWSRRAGWQALAATPFDGAALGFVHLDAKDAFNVGTQWIYATSFAPIMYEDEDAFGELHLSLQNRTATLVPDVNPDGTPGVDEVLPTMYKSIRIGYVSAA